MALVLTAPLAGPAEELAGQPLSQALERLRERGLPLLYSSRLVSSEMRVEREPAGESLREQLDELLAPHGLEARPTGSRWLVVVRVGEASDESDEALRLAEALPVTREAIVVRPALQALELPVQVLRRGRPVRGLERQDFRVFSGSRRLEIVDFDVVDLAAGAAGAAAGDGFEPSGPPAAGRRHVLVVFDLSVADPGLLGRARRSALRLLQGALHGTDLVGVATFSESRGTRWQLGFTEDRFHAGRVISSMDRPGRSSGWRDRKQKARRPSAPDQRRPDPQFEEPRGIDGDLEVLDVLRRREGRDQLRGRVRSFLGSLVGLSTTLREVPGRKHVIFLSDGSAGLVGLLGSDRRAIEQFEAYNRAVERGEPWHVDSADRFGTDWLLSDLRHAVREFRAAGCVFHSVDLRSLSAGGTQTLGSFDALDQLAIETGGRRIAGPDRLAEDIAPALETSTVTYLLGVRPPLGADRLPRLEVEVAGQDRHTRVVHQPELAGKRPWGEQGEEERRRAARHLVLAGAEGGAFTSSVVGIPLAAADGRTEVATWIEVDGPSLLRHAEADLLFAEIHAYAFDRDGELSDSFGQKVRLDLETVGARLRERGLGVLGRLRLPPGDHVLRVLVRESSSGAHSIASHPLTVPDFEQAGPVLLPPLFPGELEGTLVVRAEPSRSSGSAYPFQLDGRPFVPSARPRLRLGAARELVLIGHRLPAGAVPVTRLLDAAGEPVASGELTLSAHPASDGGWAATLVPYGVAAGRYRLEIAFEDPAGDRVAASSAVIRIGG